MSKMNVQEFDRIACVIEYTQSLVLPDADGDLNRNGGGGDCGMRPKPAIKPNYSGERDRQSLLSPSEQGNCVEKKPLRKTGISSERTSPSVVIRDRKNARNQEFPVRGSRNFGQPRKFMPKGDKSDSSMHRVVVTTR